MNRLPKWIDPGPPRNAKEWKEYNASAKKAAKEYWDSCSDDKKTVIEAVRKLQGHNDAHTRHLMMGLFMVKVCGHESTPKADVQYKTCAERLEEFLEFFVETQARQKREFEEDPYGDKKRAAKKAAKLERKKLRMEQ
jgi:hypothetical protein